MISKKVIVKLIEEREEAELNDVLAHEIREKIVNELGDNEDEIMSLLESLNDNDLYMISEAFYLIAIKLQSDTFTERLRELQEKRPNIDIEADIDGTEL